MVIWTRTNNATNHKINRSKVSLQFQFTKRSILYSIRKSSSPSKRCVAQLRCEMFLVFMRKLYAFTYRDINRRFLAAVCLLENSQPVVVFDLSVGFKFHHLHSVYVSKFMCIFIAVDILVFGVRSTYSMQWYQEKEINLTSTSTPLKCV